ncbi:hypothetical protein NX059_000361 [Plenodomus lindquistii]|nr:hypothetical protein NX059_000361 [Plenodomus lindquistii]
MVFGRRRLPTPVSVAGKPANVSSFLKNSLTMSIFQGRTVALRRRGSACPGNFLCRVPSDYPSKMKAAQCTPGFYGKDGSPGGAGKAAEAPSAGTDP